MFDALRAVTTTERRNARTRFEDLWKKHMAVDSKDINGVDVTTMTVTTMPKEKKTARSFPLNYKGNSTAMQLGSTADDRGDAHSPQRARALEPPPVPKPTEPANPSRVHESHVGSPSPSSTPPRMHLRQRKGIVRARHAQTDAQADADAGPARAHTRHPSSVLPALGCLDARRS